jgi:hypothetical protein
LRGGHHPIPLAEASGPICVQLAPLDGDYENHDVDLSSIRLVSPATGEVDEIAMEVSKRTLEGDTDRDGVAEITACFERSDLARLFSSIRGRSTVDVALEGRLKSGRKLRAPFSMTVLGTGKPEEVAALVAPNPMNPQAVLTLTVPTAGGISVKLFDVSGRLVRSVAENQPFAAGIHRIPINGRDDRGAPLPSGVYFYRIDSPGGRTQGRLVVAR